jgi:hypothetical protein
LYLVVVTGMNHPAHIGFLKEDSSFSHGRDVYRVFLQIMCGDNHMYRGTAIFDEIGKLNAGLLQFFK